MNINDYTYDSILSSKSQVYHYHIPNYQREYAWKKTNWDTLLDDIMENPVGHFMGSIICLKKDTKHGCDMVYDVVDGQQRLITLSILLMSIYKKYKGLEDGVDNDDTEYIINLNDLKNYILYTKKKPFDGEISPLNDGGKIKFLRVKPTTQNTNLGDYLYLLYDVGLLENQPEWQNNQGNRRIWTAYRFFENQLPDDRDQLDDLVNRIRNLLFIHISADDPSMAYRMFETLNNRGVPLTPVDIIKNQILSRLATPNQRELDDNYAFEQWKKIVNKLPEDIQIRFFRQYYNMYQFEKPNSDSDNKLVIKTEGLSKATQSNLTLAFKKAISTDPNSLIQDLINKADIYQGLIFPERIKQVVEIKSKLVELSRVGAAPSYASLMLLWDKGIMDEQEFVSVLDLYIKYFVRRNLTDKPPTRDLDTIQIELARKVYQALEDDESIDFKWFQSALFSDRGEPATLARLEEALQGPIYLESRDMARYILIKIEETQHTREYKPDLWERNESNKYLWTIEHIFPQGEEIKDHWVAMIAKGDPEEATRIWYESVNKLGNLSLSAYNSNLSDSPFHTKQEKHERNVYGQKLNIGYKNGLYLNNITFPVNGEQVRLSDTNEWKEEHIKSRNEVLIKKALEILRFDGEPDYR